MFRLTTLRGPTVCWELVGSTAGGQRPSQTVTNQHLSTLLALCFRRCSTSLVLDGVVYTESKIKTKLQQQHHPWLYPHFFPALYPEGHLELYLVLRWALPWALPGIYPELCPPWRGFTLLRLSFCPALPSFTRFPPELSPAGFTQLSPELSPELYSEHYPRPLPTSLTHELQPRAFP